MSQTMMQVEVPPGLQPGQQMIVQAPNGTKVMVVLPPGLGPGQKFQVAIPAGGPPPPDAAPSGGPPPAPAPPKNSVLQAKEDAARRATEAIERAKTEAAERQRREEADQKKREEAEKRKAGEEERRKQEMRDEADAFKKEMEALSASTMEAVQPVEVSSLAPPEIARQPSPIAAVPGALSRLAGAQLATIRPLLDSIKDLLTFSKISRELADFAEKPLNKNKLSKTQTMAILDSIDNQLRWPQALEVLMPALDASTKPWATEVITKGKDFDSFPKSW